MKQIAVLITIYNRKDITLRCLQLLSEQQYDRQSLSIDIYVTNDGCTDGSPDAIRQHFPNVYVLEGDGSLFWNKGMFVAWKEAAKYNYDYYLWLNDDVKLYSNAIQKLMESSNVHLNQSIIVGSTCSSNATSIITYGGWREKECPIQNVSMEQKCETMNGNVVLIPRYVFEKLGFNDIRYIHSVGDIEYGFRASKYSIVIWTAPGVVGECEKRKQDWKDCDKSFSVRFKNYWSCFGANPRNVFRLNFCYKGFFKACLYFISSFLHMLFPKLWR